jgi:V/A-type H+-transporting ATPase subunit E
MALEELIAAIGRDGAAEAAQEVARAEEEARAIRAEAEQRLARRRAEALRRRERELQAETELALASARHAARREVLFARQELLDRVFQAAGRLLPDCLDDPRYLGSALEELEHGLGYLGGREAVVRCSPALIPLFREHCVDRPDLGVEADASVGSGFVLATTDGALTVDATLERRLEELRPWLTLTVEGRLRNGAGGEGPATPAAASTIGEGAA